MARRPPSPRVDDRLVWITRAGVAIVLIATIALVCYVRLRLADVPLERDEGEYAYAGQLILKGVPPYLQAYNMKFPGVYYAYAGIMTIFGQTPRGIRTGLLAVHLSTLMILFFWGRRVVGEFAAGIGAAVFGLLALDQWSMGIFAHATHFVALAVVAAIALMQDTTRAWRLIGAGLLMGVAIAMKQQAIFFAALAVMLAMWSARAESSGIVGREAWRRGALVTGGIAITLIVMIATLAMQGVIGRFWLWTFQYASAYVSGTPLSLATTVFTMAWGYITQATGLWWYLGMAGIVLLFLSRWTAQTRGVLLACVIAAAASVVPGFFFRPHYFIVMMPFIGVLAGVTFAAIDRGVARALPPAPARLATLALFLVVAGLHVTREAAFFFHGDATDLIRSVYQTNPFLEAPEIGQYLQAHTRPDERIAVLGSEPEILFYANRPSATGYIYMYPLTERQPFASAMQAELKHDLASAPPAYVVLVDVAASWVATLRPDTRIVTWANSFTASCYDRVGIADIRPTGRSPVRWDADAEGYQAQAQSKVSIYKRRPGEACAGPGRP